MLKTKFSIKKILFIFLLVSNMILFAYALIGMQYTYSKPLEYEALRSYILWTRPAPFTVNQITATMSISLCKVLYTGANYRGTKQFTIGARLIYFPRKDTRRMQRTPVASNSLCVRAKNKKPTNFSSLRMVCEPFTDSAAQVCSPVYTYSHLVRKWFANCLVRSCIRGLRYTGIITRGSDGNIFHKY